MTYLRMVTSFLTRPVFGRLLDSVRLPEGIEYRIRAVIAWCLCSDPVPSQSVQRLGQ